MTKFTTNNKKKSSEERWDQMDRHTGLLSKGQRRGGNTVYSLPGSLCKD